MLLLIALGLFWFSVEVNMPPTLTVEALLNQKFSFGTVLEEVRKISFTAVKNFDEGFAFCMGVLFTGLAAVQLFGDNKTL